MLLLGKKTHFWGVTLCLVVIQLKTGGVSQMSNKRPGVCNLDFPTALPLKALRISPAVDQTQT